MDALFLSRAGRVSASDGKSIPQRILLCVYAAWLFVPRLSPYPELGEFCRRSYSRAFYDSCGTLLYVSPAEPDGTRREYADMTDIPQYMQDVFLRAEDRRFFIHGGVDCVAAAWALAQNMAARRTVRGASTIPMQLARLIRPGRRRSVMAKCIDSLDAVRLEARLGKRQILSLYMNNVPFGSGAEGVGSAARTFFGAEPGSLTPAQSACLAVIPRRPGLYNPAEFPGNCTEAAARLVAGIGREELEEAARSARKYEYPYYMPHYLRRVMETLPEGGRGAVRLTADLRLYRYVRSLSAEALHSAHDSRIANAAVLVIENGTGNVLCYLGNSDWQDERGGQIDGVTAPMQPGSSMKPFLYALAMERGLRPDSVLADIPVEFGGERLYMPSNFNNRFNGPVRVRVALASSLNIPAVTLLHGIGVGSYLDFLQELGFRSLGGPHVAQDAGLGLALGAGYVTLEELVRAFSLFTGDGALDGKQIISADTARVICSMLSDKSARALGFGYYQSFETDFPAIFKTGTSNQYQNITALGATRRYTVGVWMGNFSGETVVGKTGSSLPAYIARRILEELEGTSPCTEPFPEPETYARRRICSVSAMAVGADCPSSVYEYVPEGAGQEPCTWHRRGPRGARTVYPAEYQGWFFASAREGAIDYGAGVLSVRTPQDGALFYYDTQNSHMQAIPVEVTGGAEDTLLAYYDGAELPPLSRPFSFSLPVEPGEHRLRVRCGAETRELAFVVR